MSKAKQTAGKGGGPKGPVDSATKSNVPMPQQNKKKKKNAPDRPQPAWLFPPDSENPVLNPKPKTEEQTQQEYEDRMGAIKFLKHKATNTPMRTQPPSQLLQLIAAFLGAYGFNSTGRIFTLERRQKKTTTGWEDEIGKKFEKGMPDLLKIYRDWIKEWELRNKQDDETSSSEGDSEAESEDSAAEQTPAKDRKVESSGESDSNSGSEDSSDEDSDEKSKLKLKEVKKLKKQSPKSRKKSSGSSTPSSSDGDSDEPTQTSPPEKAKLGLTTQANGRQNSSDSSRTLHAPSPEKTAPTMAPDPPDDSSSSSSSSSSSEEDYPTNKGGKGSSSKSGAKATKKRAVSKSSSETSSESSDSSSDGSVDEEIPKNAGPKLEAKPNPPGPPPASKRQRSLSPKLSAAPPLPKKAKKTNTPFSRIPADTKVDPRLASNAYVPYDYANRAHQDLVVTKGRGFTKEKNKKKRGS